MVQRGLAGSSEATGRSGGDEVGTGRSKAAGRSTDGCEMKTRPHEAV